MGCDCVNYLPTGTKLEDVAEFLTILGFRPGAYFVFDKMPMYGCNFERDEDYKYFSGVEVLAYGKDGAVSVETRTSVWRTKWDSDFHNFVIKQLQKRFGGYFISDYGKGRYLRHSGPVRTAAEAGCYFAYFRLSNDFSTAYSYLQFLKELEAKDTRPKMPKHVLAVVNRHDPLIISVNLFLPFLVAILEEYFKSTYIALLRYSSRKTAIVRGARIHPDDLTIVSNGELTLEEALTKSMSFQNIGKVCAYYRDLDNKLDLAGVLKKPYRRRKESLFDMLERVLNQRHALIHKNVMEAEYNAEKALKDLHSVEVAARRFYDYLITSYGWHQWDM